MFIFSGLLQYVNYVQEWYFTVQIHISNFDMTKMV